MPSPAVIVLAVLAGLFFALATYFWLEWGRALRLWHDTLDLYRHAVAHNAWLANQVSAAREELAGLSAHTDEVLDYARQVARYKTAHDAIFLDLADTYNCHHRN